VVFASGSEVAGAALSWPSILAIAVALAMDAFAVSIAAGVIIRGVTPRHVFRIAFHFGLFQFMMPIFGWFLGEAVSSQVSAFGQWLAFGLLSVIGGKMVWNARSDKTPSVTSDPSRGLMLVVLSLATSIDALVVGAGIAFMNVAVWLPCVVIGLVAAGFSTVGMVAAGRIHRRWDRVARVLGGCVLIFIGVKAVVTL
jgi:putative Mn2+ efflux pump MntP